MDTYFLYPHTTLLLMIVQCLLSWRDHILCWWGESMSPLIPLPLPLWVSDWNWPIIRVPHLLILGNLHRDLSETHWRWVLGTVMSFPDETRVKNACQCRKRKRHGLDTWVRKIPWRRKWQRTPVFLPGESHGQRSLMDCSPRSQSLTQLSD